MEDLKQRLHEQKLALNREIALREDATLEVEKLTADLVESQKRIDALRSSQGDDMRALKDKIIALTNENESQRLEYEAKLNGLEESLKMCKAEKSIVPNSCNHQDEIDSLRDQLLKCQDKISELFEQVEVQKSELVLSEERCLELGQCYEETKSCLDIKKSEFAKAVETIKELQEGMALMSTELDVLKAGAVGDIVRGNSLFKEVEDKRKKMAANYNVLKNKYLEYKNVITQKNQEIASLKAQVITLKKYDLNVEDQIRTINSKYIEACEKRIQDLEAINAMLEKRKESPEIVTIGDDPAQFQWIRVAIEQARAETQKTIDECQKISSSSFKTASALRKAELEMKDLKIDVMRKSACIEELEQRCSVMQARTKEDTASLLNIPKDSALSSKTSNKTIRFADAELEETCLTDK